MLQLQFGIWIHQTEDEKAQHTTPSSIWLHNGLACLQYTYVEQNNHCYKRYRLLTIIRITIPPDTRFIPSVNVCVRVRVSVWVYASQQICHTNHIFPYFINLAYTSVPVKHRTHSNLFIDLLARCGNYTMHTFIYPIQVACLRPAVLHIIRIGMRVFKTSAIPNASERGAVLCPLNCFRFSINVYVVCQREHRLHSLCFFFQAIHRRVKIGIRYPHNHQCSI